MIWVLGTTNNDVQLQLAEHVVEPREQYVRLKAVVRPALLFVAEAPESLADSGQVCEFRAWCSGLGAKGSVGLFMLKNYHMDMGCM